MKQQGSVATASLAFVIYVLTLAPTFLWSDSAKLAIYAFERNFTLVTVGSHPMHTVAGVLFALLPLNLAYSQNLMSAVFAAGAIYFLHRTLQLVTGSGIASFLACTALAVSQMFWLYAVINETYALVACALSALLYFSVCWDREQRPLYLYILALITGMSFANHAMTLLFLPGILVILWKRPLLRTILSPRILMVLAAFAVGAAPLFLLPAVQGLSVRDALSQVAASIFDANDTYSGQGLAKLFTQLARYPLYAGFQFPLGVFAALYGLFRGMKSDPKRTAATLLLWLIVVLFSMQYFLQRQFALLIPSFVIVAYWIGLGIAAFQTQHPDWTRAGRIALLFILLCIVPPSVYYGAYKYSQAHPFNLGSVRQLPYRNNYRYYLFPPKSDEFGAERYANDSFQQARQGALIVADFNPGMALLYSQEVLKQRPDLKIDVIVDDWVHFSKSPESEALAYIRKKIVDEHRIVYLADNWEAYYHTSAIEKEFRLEQKGGPLWEVREKK